ncbi:MAG: peroxide stress protein YaaA [Rickettsiales bacterium]|nr:peroxide stress protein YaaA [Rickettsiales bacterium]
MLILLSPAKSLNYQTKILQKNFSIPHFENETKKLAATLKKLSVSDLEKLMTISKNLAQLNFQRWQNFAPNYNLQNSKPALLVFDGDVYKPIDKENFSQSDFDFAQKNLRILSGFYGILKPLDLIQPYRLEMATDFQKSNLKNILGVKNLYQFWGDKISNYLNLECKNNAVKHVINLASEEYFSAINPQKISAKIINIVFKENKNGVYKIIGINAKKARGLMTNFIIKNKISVPGDLKNFKSENYRFEKTLSDELNFTFVR